MKIDGKEVDENGRDYLSPVTYIPAHANGNAGHPDCEPGVLIGMSVDGTALRVLYCKERTVQVTRPEDLVWG